MATSETFNFQHDWKLRHDILSIAGTARVLARALRQAHPDAPELAPLLDQLDLLQADAQVAADRMVPPP